ncbi:branched-chain amino acid ABC transporter substrate-binding protein [Burkholderia sp. Bp8963]|uniref:branched-chain amino acid ABC transporter substrate-binding protein n=1 Tax=Burkholderia sp. Bp8963 TaxID=2184547 RepID=UPI000F59ABF6|nr:branched-chain amino acid ABC transporter substrate-binding protein [Burkholderia sp. Bp8963]RQS76321.1 branched-chain amino acid ABC transporter substrate-binding protein [Burkholderia sp. Bp8963]
MHVKLAYAESVAAAVAMLAACSKKSDDGAGREAAASAAPQASDVRAVRISHAAPLTGSIAHLGKDNENGAGLAIEEINTHGLTIGGRPVWLERVAATDAQQGPALADHALHALHAKRFAVVDDATAYGQGLADEFANTVEAAGGQIVAREATDGRATNFNAILTKIKSDHPDVIMYGGMDATGGPLAKQALALGIEARILGGDGVCTDKVVELAGNAVQDLICSEAGLALSRMEKEADFEKKVEDRFHTPVQIYAPFTYDAFYVIVDAMKRANSTDASRVPGAMPSTDYRGVIGHIAFAPNGDLKEGAMTLYDFKEAKKTVLDVVTM